MPDHHSHHHDTDTRAHEHDGAGDAALAELLDLDGQVLRSYWTQALTWVRHAAPGTGRRILDLGAGSGTGTIALAQRFAAAEVIAVDVSDEMLRRIRAKALDLGLADRVRTVQADLDGDWPAVDALDLTWASMSMHHLADPDRVLGDVFAATRAGGLLAVAEIAEPVRFLPHDLGFGRPGLEARCLDVLETEHARSLPELGSDWSSRLEAAGFTDLDERTFVIDLTAPLPTGADRYAQRWLERLRSGLAHRLDDDDDGALATLIDGDGPGSLQRRDDLHIRGSRTVTLARRR